MKRGLLLLLILISASPAFAFPDNAVLDTFNGCTDNVSPPNSNWTNTIFRGGSSVTVDCEDNAITSTSASEGDIYWNATAFNADMEAYATIVSLTGFAEGIVGVRIVNEGANTGDGYDVMVTDADNMITLQLVNNGSPSTLDATAQTVTVGDSFGITAIGSQICSWYKVGAGAWTQIACVADTTFSAGGHLTVSVLGNASIGCLDDVGGGNVTAAVSSSRHAHPVVFQ